MFLSTEIFSKRRKIYAWLEEKPEFGIQQHQYMTCLMENLKNGVLIQSNIENGLKTTLLLSLHNDNSTNNLSRSILLLVFAQSGIAQTFMIPVSHHNPKSGQQFVGHEFLTKS